MTIETITLLFSRHGANLSLQLLFLAGAAMIVLKKGLPEKTYSFLLYLVSFGYLLLFYGRSLRSFSMAGDNICQIAYWKILFHPNLTGSIGASYTKPGQLLILGPLFELSRVFGDSAFRIGICLVMAACIWMDNAICWTAAAAAVGTLLRRSWSCTRSL